MGNRADELGVALDSLAPHPARVLVNGAPVGPAPIAPHASMLTTPANLGVPGGRDFLVSSSESSVVGFLDDDAVAADGVSERVLAAFDVDERLGAVALRIVDERGQTTRRHVPRLGGRHPNQGGDVALFLGGACAIRRESYDDAGGYWSELFYGHEEVELAWRLIDRGWTIRYLPEARVFHPRTEIGRHSDGWFMTGRNRVMVARRTLPWPVAMVHVSAWLVLGTIRANGSGNRRAYLRGWRQGWSMRVVHQPIRWRTVWRLTRLGRPPVF